MIRALSVVGHGVNLIPHYIDHYLKYVDEIQFAIYETDKYPQLGHEISKIIEGNDKVKIVKTIKDRIFDWERVTQLYNFIKSKNPNDWWVIADIDEFHLYPNDDLWKLINDCEVNGWDLIRGGFIDRVGPVGEFAKIISDVNIFEQFPNAGFFRYPMSKACPNKVCVMKGYVELTAGQHYAKIDGQTTWKWQGWNHPLINPRSFVQVHHFKWDETAGDRMREVANTNQSYAYSEEYGTMYRQLVKTRFKVDLNETEFMFEFGLDKPEFKRYRQWDKLIKKIMTI